MIRKKITSQIGIKYLRINISPPLYLPVIIRYYLNMLIIPFVNNLILFYTTLYYQNTWRIAI